MTNYCGSYVVLTEAEILALHELQEPGQILSVYRDRGEATLAREENNYWAFNAIANMRFPREVMK